MVAGFTLIEVMIVLVVIATLAFMGTNMLTGTFRVKSRELSWRMASTVKYLYNSAVMENKTVRLVFDFESNSYWAEATSERFLLEKESDKKEPPKMAGEGSKEYKGEEGGAKDSEVSGGGDAEAVKEEPYVEPLEPTFGTVSTPLLETRGLPVGLYLKDVFTTHDGAPVTAGRAYIYFFSNGYAEAAVINFRDADDTKYISVRIEPFSGTTNISPEYGKLEETNK